MPGPHTLLVADDNNDFYGKRYYQHVQPAHGLPSLGDRARSDLTERCLHWLRYLLRHKLPPGKVLEIGCAHGGFVALLQASGFDATGLELSPWLSAYARDTFAVPVLEGPLESQDIAPSSLDAIVLMDVLEHLPDPAATMAHAARLLKPGGLFLIQTPRYREGKSLAAMRAGQDRFVEMLIPDQHLHLFSEKGIRMLLERAGLPHLLFEPAIFSHYDMFVAAAREPLETFSDEEIRSRLEERPAARLPLALLDMDALRRNIEDRLSESEADRAARLAVINDLESRYRESEADRSARYESIERWEAHARELTLALQQVRSELDEARAASTAIENRAAAAEERASVHERRAAELHAQSVAQRQVIEHQSGLLNRLHASRIYGAMRRMGLWGWLDHAAPAPEEVDGPAPVQSKELRRVAIDLTPVLPGGENGGAKVVIMELVRRLSKIAPECQFVLLTHERTHQELAALDAANVARVCAAGAAAAKGGEKLAIESRAALSKVLPSKVLDRASSVYRSVAGAKSGGLLREIEADVLFCPFTAPFFFEPGTPVVSLVHDLQFVTYPQFFNPADREERTRNFHRACRVSSKVVCVSEFVRGTVLANSSLPPERVTAIHTRAAARLARSSEDARAQTLARLGLTADRFLVYPANFWAHKNHEMLLTGMGMYAAAHPESTLKLVLTGAPGARRDELIEAVRQMGLESRVIFPGFVPESDLAALMDGCLAVIFPSLFEGFGLPLLEAMAAGKPVLASNVTSLPEVGGDAVLFFDPRKPSEIAAAIHRIEHDAALRDILREKGRKRVEWFGGPERMAAEYLQVLREAVSGPALLDPGIYGVYSDGWAGDHITISYAGNGRPQQLSLEVSLPAWAPVQTLSLTEARGSAGTPQSHRIKRGEAVTISKDLGAGPGTLELRCSPTFQPKACSIGDDVRVLSCHVVRADIATSDGHTTDLKAMSHAG